MCSTTLSFVLTLVSRSAQLFSFFSKIQRNYFHVFQKFSEIICMPLSEISQHAIQHSIRLNWLFSKIALNGFFH